MVNFSEIFLCEMQEKYGLSELRPVWCVGLKIGIDQELVLQKLE